MSQQFNSDDVAFEAALTSAQAAVKNLPSGAGADQVAQAVQPLMTAAELYQRQIVNLLWSSTAKPRAQLLTEDVGQVTADITEIQRPGGFVSVANFISQLSPAANAVRAAAKGLGAQIGT